ncbi:uncharacterized protein N7496_002412 [Penicillium cataractarum]|uniref:NYN domain-containing protein n=1 Tax=Penicillium cataractarum TaxID=2100454 RepID=A0A9W9SMH2_9EURO|nr:uncharacterized protein N7496_002412 [Penicillium cataractarum]KAJ5379984.1 hypothetical protein N7496_002412 [Penicillium cataractarum]
MLATETTDPASNWDFSQVLDLLRSPTYESSPDVAHHIDITVAPAGNGPSSQAPSYGASSHPDEVKPQLLSTKLGDFGLIWDLLSKDDTSSKNDSAPGDTRQPPLDRLPALTILKRPLPDEPVKGTSTPPKSVPVLKTSKSPVTKESTLNRSQPSPASLVQEPVTILKRAAGSYPTKSDVAATSPPKASSRVIGNTTKPTEIPKANTKPKPAGKVTKASVDPEPILSESSTGAESDSSTVVFDQPITKKSGVLAFVPAQVGGRDARDNHDDTPPSSYDEADWTLNSDAVQNIITTSAGIRVLPAAYKTATERRIGLMTKLLREFPEYAQLVLQVGRSSTSTKNSVERRPIHVFVDMSNIMVGFHDSVKVSRNIPVSTRIRRLHMSFANFSLIMERGRPAAKRVLVGSDRLPSIAEAEQLGYEANILDRVHKVKHTTPRPSKFRKAPGSATHPTSGPETVGTTGERWVEQGVDEILHLKMLESIVDTDKPSTIVLATGDAAVAEYSGGFMRMVERALQRGWNVELVSFSQVTSNAYRKKEFRAKWGQQFQMIELDSYVEELFD